MGDVVELVPVDEQIAIRALARSGRWLPTREAIERQDGAPRVVAGRPFVPSPELRALMRVADVLERKGLVTFGRASRDGTRRVALTAAGEELARELGDGEP